MSVHIKVILDENNNKKLFFKIFILIFPQDYEQSIWQY